LKAPNLVINIFRDKIIKAYADLKSEIKNQINKKNLILNNFDKIIKPPLSKIELNKSLLNNLNKNIEKNIVEKKLISKENLLKLSRLLYSNSIAANLKKGYSILTKKNKIVKTSKDIKINDSMKAQLQNGSLEIVVKKIN
jgi:exodeoxyribonuclease VII large subunit